MPGLWGESAQTERCIAPIDALDRFPKLAPAAWAASAAQGDEEGRSAPVNIGLVGLPKSDFRCSRIRVLQGACGEVHCGEGFGTLPPTGMRDDSCGVLRDVTQGLADTQGLTAICI